MSSQPTPAMFARTRAPQSYNALRLRAKRSRQNKPVDGVLDVSSSATPSWPVRRVQALEAMSGWGSDRQVG